MLTHLFDPLALKGCTDGLPREVILGLMNEDIRMRKKHKP